jgi:hypothetical protein
MIVDDLDVVRVCSEPAEADSPLIVDSDAVLASSVTGEFFKAIRRRDAEINEAGRGIEHNEFAKGNSVKVRRHSANPLPFEKALGVGVAKAADHSPIVTRGVTTCKSLQKARCSSAASL